MSRTRKQKVVFYADTSLFTNKFFCFQVSSQAAALAAVKRFQKKGWHVRAAWWRKCSDGLVVLSQRLIINNP